MKEADTKPSVERSETRRRDPVRTKARILRSAMEIFGQKGYAAAGLREIADHAGVALSLVPLHFGSKAKLFEVALVAAIGTNRALSGAREDYGRALVDYAFSGPPHLAAMIALAPADPVAREITERVMREKMVPRFAEMLGGERAEERALEINMIAMGFHIYARQLGIAPVSAETRERFAVLIQSLIDENGDGVAPSGRGA